MRNVARSAVMVAALAALPAISSAQTCGGSTFATCASVSITKQDMGGGVTEIVMSVTNLSGTNGTQSGTIFTSMGLFGLSNFSYVSGSLSFVGSGSWTLGTSGLSGAGIVAKVAGVGAAPPPVQNGLAAGQSVTLTFRISGPSFASIDTNDWAIHGLGGYNACSTKLVVTNGAANSGPYDPNCSPPDDGGGTGTAVTPEPGSMVLLTTGLFGMAGVARRRRKV